MKIEVGKSYRARDGRTFGPIIETPARWQHSLRWIFGFERNGLRWSWDSDGFEDDENHPGDADLIAEFSESQAAACVDASTLKDGDTVLVRGEVSSSIRYNDAGITRQNVFFGKKIIGIDVRDIVSAEPRPLVVGDRVKDAGGASTWSGELIAIDGPSGWVKVADGEHRTVWLSDTVRA